MEWFILLVIALSALALVLFITLLIIGNAVFNRVARRPDGDKIKDFKNLANRTPDYYENLYKSMDKLKEKRFERVDITSKDGLNLAGFYFPSDKPSDKFVICVHGFTSYGFRGFASFADFYNGIGVNMLLIDNRAHGESEGKYAGMGILERYDIVCWIDYLIGRFGEGIKVYLHGNSMGAAAVVMASGLDLPEQVKGIIADAPFTNFYDQMNHTIKAASGMSGALMVKLASFIARRRAGYGFKDVDGAKEIKKAKVPFLFVHGDADYFVPHKWSEILYAACPTQKDFFLVKDAGHSACYYISPKEYENKILWLLNLETALE
ncbi:MAG: alpha/beta hydrolase [Christensenellales bacterium]|jgi:pimeloyl-ACP methyl ester carboxylesterase